MENRVTEQTSAYDNLQDMSVRDILTGINREDSLVPGAVAKVIPTMEQLVERTGVDPASIVLEMTESYFVTDMDALRATFDRLRSIGIRIAMDDFGTGYSSLGLLAQSPADIVKIDRLFIKNIHVESFNRAFIDAGAIKAE